VSLLQAAVVAPARRVSGRLRVPGDKSISHRYAILAALAEGRSTLANFAPGADCASTLACLQRLGVDVDVAGADTRTDATAATVTVMGRGPGRLRSPSAPLDAGNSGTTMRLMAGVLAGQAFSATLVGDASLSRRPMRRVIVPLEQMGARVDAAPGGRAPLTIHGTRLHAIAFRPEVPSAQVKSAVLLAGLFADGVTTVTEPAATRDHTERALRAFGGEARAEGLTVSIAPNQRLTGRAATVPGDFSSAAFWLVAAAGLAGSRVEIEDLGLNPTRTALLGVLRRYGAHVEIARTDEGGGAEPRGTVVVAHDHAADLAIAPDEVPGLIDELPAIAALAAYGGEVSVSGAAELRVKESDRIAVLVAGFRALGLDADERPDGFAVRRPSSPAGRPAGGVADAQGDHRMAMAFAVAALAAEGPSTIEGADAVGISYPGFFDTMARLVA
jgi:3-phosphoshikimate 1-carboxyvinyltransferase